MQRVWESDVATSWQFPLFLVPRINLSQFQPSGEAESKGGNNSRGAVEDPLSEVRAAIPDLTEMEIREQENLFLGAGAGLGPPPRWGDKNPQKLFPLQFQRASSSSQRTIGGAAGKFGSTNGSSSSSGGPFRGPVHTVDKGMNMKNMSNKTFGKSAAGQAGFASGGAPGDVGGWDHGGGPKSCPGQKGFGGGGGNQYAGAGGGSGKTYGGGGGKTYGDQGGGFGNKAGGPSAGGAPRGGFSGEQCIGGRQQGIICPRDRVRKGSMQLYVVSFVLQVYRI